PVPLVNVTELGVPMTRPLGSVVDHDATPPALVTATEFVGGLTNNGTDIVPLLIVMVELSGCTKPRCSDVAVCTAGAASDRIKKVDEPFIAAGPAVAVGLPLEAGVPVRNVTNVTGVDPTVTGTGI